MQSEVRRLCAPATVLLLLAVLHACSEGGSTGPNPNEVATVTITAAGSTSIPLNGTVQLQASLQNAQGGTATATVSWNSQTTTVAQVTQTGLVTGVGEGSSQITASAGGKSSQITVTVTDPNPPGQPSNLQATVVSNTRIDLTWTDGSTNEQSFRVERGPVVPGAVSAEESGAVLAFEEMANLSAGTTSYSDTGLTPDQAYGYRVRACNQNGCSAYTSEVERTTFQTLEIQTAALPGGTVNTVYDQTLAATGGSGDAAWSIASGSLPPGLTLAGTTGLISGTPTAAGTFTFTVRATGGGQTVDRPLEIQISVQILPVQISTTSLPDGTVGANYDQTLEATGGDGESYTWSVTAGNLPGGLALAGATGVISGTPNAAGTFNFTVQAESGGQTDTQPLSIAITDTPPVVIDNWYLPVGVTGTAYSHDIEASGGIGGFTFSIAGGTLPPGISLGASDGKLTGTPGGTGTFFFEVEVASGAATATRVFALSISTVGLGGFNIAILNAPGTFPHPALVTALNGAVARWEGVITSDFAAYVKPVDFPEGFCRGHGNKLRTGESVEDLLIWLDWEFDAPGGTLARAGPCGHIIGTPGRIPTATLTMDEADVGLAADRFLALMIHEIGHALGFGTSRWDAWGVITGRGSDGACGANPRYTGTSGVAAYKGPLGGPDADIPLEDTGGTGTCETHWRESVFDNEVMTGFIEMTGVAMPLSIMTIESLRDIGYSVNAGAADSYSIPGSALVVPGALQATGDPLGDDVVIEPLIQIRPDGSMRTIYPQGWTGW